MSSRPVGWWDAWFLSLAKHVSTASKDPSTKCGAVLVRPDRSVCSVGFNGFPRNMSDSEELYQNREEKYSRIVHAEVNALLFSREPVKDYTLYTYPFACCDRCVVQMIQAGIHCFIFPKCPVNLQERWGAILDKSKKYIKETDNCTYIEIEMEEMF